MYGTQRESVPAREAFSTKAKKCSFTSKNLLTSVWLVYVLQSVGTLPGGLADVTGVRRECSPIRPIGHYVLVLCRQDALLHFQLCGTLARKAPLVPRMSPKREFPRMKRPWPACKRTMQALWKFFLTATLA